MAQEILEQALEMAPDDQIASSSMSEPIASGDPSLQKSHSFSRLNAGAPEFVPRSPPPQAQAGHHHHHHHSATPHPRMVKIHGGGGGGGGHHHPHAPPPVIHVFHPPPAPAPPAGHQFVEYYGGGGGFGEPEVVQAPPADPDPAPPEREGLSDDVIQKVTKQVEYYFSDANLATTEHLMRFIMKDPEGFVPISVIASFKKIKALVHNHSLLATALRTSTKLVVSDDGKKVRRQQPFTESDVEELQSRIVVAENLPEDHCYQNLMKIFCVAGSVKTIRTCYPQTPNGTAAATNRSSKMDMLFYNKLHAFVEYDTVEDAEKAVAELNDERNWRSGLRVRLLNSCMTKHGTGRGRKAGYEGDGNAEEDVSTTNQPSEKHVDDSSQQTEASLEHMGQEGLNDREGGGARRGRGRGRGGKGRGRGQYNNSNNHRNSGGHPIGTPPSSHPIHSEHPAVNKQPPGPRMPDGTRGFTMGRGKPLPPTSTTTG